ncbi:MAG: chemotaxis protein CheW [candidate division WOR-3 bacterium]|jgi:purine-binding chemotaxis protein CheW
MKKKVDLSSLFKSGRQKPEDKKEKVKEQNEIEPLKTERLETEEIKEENFSYEKENVLDENIKELKNVEQKDEEKIFLVEKKVSKKENEFEDEKEYVSFKLNEEEYGIDSDLVKQIIKYKDPLDLGIKSKSFFGVLNDKEGFLPLFDLREKFGLKINKRSENGSIVIMKLDELRIGFYVDKLIGIVKMEKSDIKKIPPFLPEEKLKYIEGVGIFKNEKRIIIILNYLSLFSQEEIKELKKIPEIYR